MPWIIGIDEAGYGPNLGPFVMTSVACRVPQDLGGSDLWQVLKPAVRRGHGRARARLVVGYPKLFSPPPPGRTHLKKSGVPPLPRGRSGKELPPAQYVEGACPACHDDLRAEPWYSGSHPLPLVAKH